MFQLLSWDSWRHCCVRRNKWGFICKCEEVAAWNRTELWSCEQNIRWVIPHFFFVNLSHTDSCYWSYWSYWSVVFLCLQLAIKMMHLIERWFSLKMLRDLLIKWTFNYLKPVPRTISMLKRFVLYRLSAQTVKLCFHSMILMIFSFLRCLWLSQDKYWELNKSIKNGKLFIRRQLISEKAPTKRKENAVNRENAKRYCASVFLNQLQGNRIILRIEVCLFHKFWKFFSFFLPELYLLLEMTPRISAPWSWGLALFITYVISSTFVLLC